MSTTISAQPYDAAPAKGRKIFKTDPLQEKVKKNVLWIGIISIVMLFAGLTSAVIVSKGGNFWVSATLPKAFWISTSLVLLGSVTLFLSKRTIRAGNLGATKSLLLITLLLGIGFGIFQFIGYGQLVKSGYFLTSRIMDDKQNFIPQGEYGKDFVITWQGEKLTYENGMFFTSKGPLSEQAKLKLLYTRNNASSFIYFLSFLHLLHMLGGVLYLLVITIYAFQERFDSSNYLKIKLGNIYWHFLGFLWIYLFVFLQYIH